jgi:hypothetical protein
MNRKSGLVMTCRCAFNREKWLATSITTAEILDTPKGHLTLLFGVTADGWETAHRIISEAALKSSDIVFEDEPRLVEPSHSIDKSYWCLHVDASASPKLVMLIETLREHVLTPGEKADHEVLPHMTCLIVKRHVQVPK